MVKSSLLLSRPVTASRELWPMQKRVSQCLPTPPTSQCAHNRHRARQCAVGTAALVWRGWYLNWVTRRSEDSPPGRKVCCGCQKGEQAQARGSSGKQHWRVQPEVGVAAVSLKSWLRPVLGGLAKLEVSNIPSASTAAPASARVCCGAGDSRGRRAGVSPALHGPVLREDGHGRVGHDQVHRGGEA